MKKQSLTLSRCFLYSCLVILLIISPIFICNATATDEFKIGFFSEHTGPAALFGESARACAALAVDEINAAGGILGKPISLVNADSGQPPAQAANTVIKLAFKDKVDFVMASCNSAVKDTIVATLKAKVPFVYTPMYEGGTCAKNVFITADTAHQQLSQTIPWFTKKYNLKKWYFLGNDIVWGRKVNMMAKKIIEETHGEVLNTEYVPWGASNSYEEIVARIKAAKPDIVLITLVGSDNINFNKTFAGFGLDKKYFKIGRKS